jgi:uncharacterized protein YqgC (DUF456 family)
VIPWLDLTLRIGTLIVLLITWVAMVIPAFPAPAVMWIFTLIYGLLAGFEAGGALYFAAITLLTIFALLADNVLMLGNARKAGARWSSLVVAFIAGTLGSLLLTPLLGIPITLLALFLMEYARQKDADQAWASTKSMVFGWGWSVVVRLLLGLAMLILWAMWAWL